MDIIRIFVPEACEQEASPVGCGGPVPIGYVGESGVRQVVLDFSPWVETYGPGALTLMVRRNSDADAYPVTLEIDGSTAAWTVSNVDTHIYGVGRAQYMYVVDGENVKSAIFQTFVDKSVTQPGSDPPDPYEGWVQHLTELGAETLVNAQSAAESAEAALAAKTAAETAQASAAESATAAAGSASDAAAAKTAAETAQASAAGSATDAAGSATQAASSETAAAGSATAAGNAQAAAEAAQELAEDAQEAAEQAQSDAEAAAQSVSQSAAQIETNRQNISDLKSAKAPVIIDTASGTIASFEDGADGLPLKKLVVNIEPAQSGSGDPSPENVRPISGWTGCILSQSGADTSNPSVKSIAFPTPPGTVYGGTLDVTTGELVVDRVIKVFDGTEELVSSNGYFLYRVSTGYIAEEDNAISSHLLENNDIKSTNAQTGFRWFIRSTTPSKGANILIRFYKNQPEEELRAYLAEQYAADTPFTVVAKLLPAYAQSYQLTAEQITTLFGTNNIWADCGPVSVDYPADTKLYISKRLTAVVQMLSNFETGMTASKAYAVNDFLTVNNQLYIVTAPIANGGTITPGTNVTETTIGAQITGIINT